MGRIAFGELDIFMDLRPVLHVKLEKVFTVCPESTVITCRGSIGDDRVDHLVRNPLLVNHSVYAAKLSIFNLIAKWH